MQTTLRCVPLLVLVFATTVHAGALYPVCGDVNSSGDITTSDALVVLKTAVGQPSTLVCGNFSVIATNGNTTEFPAGNTGAPDYLLGSALNIPVASSVIHLGVIGKSAGAQVQLALYTDVGNQPGTLVVSTAAHTLTPGVNELPVQTTAVPAGQYWIMGVYDAGWSIGFDLGTLSAVVRYRTHTFGTLLPNEFGDNQTYTGQRFNYYVKVAQ